MGIVQEWVLQLQLSGGKLSHRIYTRTGVQMIHQLYMVDRKAEPTGVFTSIEMGLLSPGRSFKPNLSRKLIFCRWYSAYFFHCLAGHSLLRSLIVYIYYILYICITWADLDFVCHSTGKYFIYQNINDYLAAKSHPLNLTWNPKGSGLEDDFPILYSIWSFFGFHVECRGCNFSFGGSK